MATAPDAPFVVVGGGPAAAAATRVLAAGGGRVVVLTDEDVAAYDRTHLSKQVLTDGAQPGSLWADDEDWRDRVEVRTSSPVEALDLTGRRVVTASGPVRYERLLLATGAVPRRLELPGETGPGVHHLRRLPDARGLAAELVAGRRVVLVGGGLIGLEVAAAATARGLDVHVLEAAPRILTRGVPDVVAALVRGRHEAAGVRFTTAARPVRIDRAADGAVTGVGLADGAVVPADLVVVGVGVRPADGPAVAAGLTVDDGIVVDGSCRTSDPHIWAAGDVARMRTAGGGGVRLESFTDAQRLAETAAASMLGEDAVHDAVPYAWSDQYELTVSSLGSAPDEAALVTVCTQTEAAALALVGGVLRAATVAGAPERTGRLVATARHAIASGVVLDVARLGGSDDLAALAKTLLTALRAAG